MGTFGDMYMKMWGVLNHKKGGLWWQMIKITGLSRMRSSGGCTHWIAIGGQKECTWHRPWYVSAPGVEIHAFDDSLGLIYFRKSNKVLEADS